MTLRAPTPRGDDAALSTPTPTRRDLLRTVALGAGAAATLPLLAAPALGQSHPSAEEVRQRYQVNPWIERYYALNRL